MEAVNKQHSYHPRANGGAALRSSPLLLALIQSNRRFNSCAVSRSTISHRTTQRNSHIPPRAGAAICWGLCLLYIAAQTPQRAPPLRQQPTLGLPTSRVTAGAATKLRATHALTPPRPRRATTATAATPPRRRRRGLRHETDQRAPVPPRRASGRGRPDPAPPGALRGGRGRLRVVPDPGHRRGNERDARGLRRGAHARAAARISCWLVLALPRPSILRLPKSKAAKIIDNELRLFEFGRRPQVRLRRLRRTPRRRDEAVARRRADVGRPRGHLRSVCRALRRPVLLDVSR